MNLRYRTTIPPLALAAMLVSLSGPVAAQQDPETQPAAAALESRPAEDAVARKRLDAAERRLEALDVKLGAAQAERAQLEAQVKALQGQLADSEARAAQAEVEAQEERDRLQIYGWLDVNFSSTLNMDEQSNLYGYFGGTPSFFLGNMNLVFDAKPLEHWRAMIETRLTYSPDGQLLQGAAGLDYRDTSVLDVNGSTLAQYKWSALSIERAWIEWGPRDWFKLRAGQWLTPYGIWNLEHGTPVLISVMAPFLLSLQMFPSYQVGLQAHGTLLFGSEQLGYSVTLSNGRVSVANVDLDENKAVGARLTFTSSRVGELKLGLSFYHGRYTAKGYDFINRDPETGQDLTVQPPLLPRLQARVSDEHDETAFGADLQFDYEGLGLRSELAYRETRYLDGHRPAAPTSQVGAFGIGQASTPLADYADFSIYGLAFYRLPWLDLRPFLRVDWMDLNDNMSWDDVCTISAGLNYRPTTRFVLKAELYWVLFPNDREHTVNAEYQSSLKRDVIFLGLQGAFTF